MIRYITIFVHLTVVVLLATACTSEEKPAMLVFSKTAGYRHASIDRGKKFMEDIAKNINYNVILTEDASVFSKDRLSNTKVVVFLNTTGDILNEEQQNVFEEFIGSGGGFIGIHAATDTEYHWPWYGKLVGAYFDGHPNDPNMREATVTKERQHAITEAVPDVWTRNDEWYNYKNLNPAIEILLSLDENSYEGGTMNNHHPITWCHEFSGGKVFYTGMGHSEETYDDPMFKNMVERAVEYVTGIEN